MLHDCLASISISTNTTVPNFFFAIKFHFRETIFNSWIHAQVDKVAMRWWRWTTTTTSPATRKVKEIERDVMRKKNKNRRRHDDGIKEEIESLSIPSKNVNSHNSCFFFLLLLFPIVAAAAVCKTQNKTKKKLIPANISVKISRERKLFRAHRLLSSSGSLAKLHHSNNIDSNSWRYKRKSPRREWEPERARKKNTSSTFRSDRELWLFFLSFFYFASRESS